MQHHCWQQLEPFKQQQHKQHSQQQKPAAAANQSNT